MAGRSAGPVSRRSLSSELVGHLAFVMVAATGLLAAVLVASHESRSRELLARALAAEARGDPNARTTFVPGTTWWIVTSDGRVEARGPAHAPFDEETRALANESLGSGDTLLRPGGGDEPLRFATVLEDGRRVAVARVPSEGPLRQGLSLGQSALVVLLADAVVFTLFGATVLRRRVVLPLRRLAAAARAIADGERGTRVPVEGARETALVATAFNEMTEALEGRSEALEKAVAELRGANESLRSAEAGLARADRMAAIGRLAAGVAHEVGNPMGALLAFVELAERDVRLPDEARAHLARARGQGERVRTILRQLLDYSRPPRGSREALALERVAEETLSLVRAQRRYAALRFELRCEAGVAPAAADPGAVAQILLNLVLNAADAVASGAPGGAGRVRLLVRPGVLVQRAGDPPGATPARRRPDAVACWIVDDGPGIAPEDRERIFDPFFTTKPPGEGTGLGLANALRLATEQGGALDLAEAAPPGAEDLRGAAFVLRLPLWRGAGDPAGDCGARTPVRSTDAL